MTKRMRKIVRIDEEKCDGCGLCVPDCAEGAIKIVEGKARLVAENLCDGLGNCLGACPKDAIVIEERLADDFDAASVRARLDQAAGHEPAGPPRGCPGSMMRNLHGGTSPVGPALPDAGEGAARPSCLRHWPVQLALVPVSGDIWHDADVLIAADCVGLTMPDFQNRLLAGDKKTLAIACPKLDDVEPYIENLASIFAGNAIRSLTVAHMEVPCCRGIVAMTTEALRRSGRTDLSLRDVTVRISGSVVDEG